MKPPEIVVVGSSNTDLVVVGPALPVPGETVTGGEFITAAGGKGANQAVAAARLGGSVTLIARVGTDAFGDRTLANLSREGVAVEFVARDPDFPTGVAMILVGDRGQNMISVAPGANARVTPAAVEAAAETIRRADFLLLQLEIPMTTVGRAARLAGAAGVGVILDPSPVKELDDELLGWVSYLTPNEREAELLTGIEITDRSSAERAAARLHARGAANVLLTVGVAGCVIHDAGGSRHVAGREVEAVDSTAAGDTFNGALACALAAGASLDDAVEFANAAAALSVTRRGAQPSMPTREELQRFLL